MSRSHQRGIKLLWHPQLVEYYGSMYVCIYITESCYNFLSLTHKCLLFAVIRQRTTKVTDTFRMSYSYLIVKWYILTYLINVQNFQLLLLKPKNTRMGFIDKLEIASLV